MICMRRARARAPEIFLVAATRFFLASCCNFAAVFWCPTQCSVGLWFVPAVDCRMCLPSLTRGRRTLISSLVADTGWGRPTGLTVPLGRDADVPPSAMYAAPSRNHTTLPPSPRAE